MGRIKPKFQSDGDLANSLLDFIYVIYEDDDGYEKFFTFMKAQSQAVQRSLIFALYAKPKRWPRLMEKAPKQFFVGGAQ